MLAASVGLCLARRAVVTSLIAGAMLRPLPGGAATVGAVAPEDLEERLIERLRAGGAAAKRLAPADVAAAEALMDELERSGGSQLQAAEGIGSWGSWIGAWDVLYCGAACADGPLAPRPAKTDGAQLRLVGARQYVYGPSNSREDLKGVGRDGGTSTELLYAPSLDEAPSLLLARSGSFTKLPAYAFRVEFPQLPRAFELPVETGGGALRPLPAAELGAPAGGAWSRDISYLSERLWISRSSADGGRRVLLRSDAVPLVPPAERPDLTYMCSDAVFVRGSICRKKALF